MCVHFNKFIRSVNSRNKSDPDDFINSIKQNLKKTISDFENLTKYFEIPNFSIPNLTIQNYSNIFSNSNLIKNPKDKNFIFKILLNYQKIKKITLLYKATKNGFKSSTFHSLCDKKGATITFIKSNYGKIFGGFINDSWHSKDCWTYSKESFLFSLNRKEKYEHKNIKDKIHSFYGGHQYLARFGGGKDIHISDNCNSNKNSHSNFGHTYQSPEGIEYESADAKSYLAGGFNFKVEEIEVYQLES